MGQYSPLALTMPPMPQDTVYMAIGGTVLAVAAAIAFYVLSTRKKKA